MLADFQLLCTNLKIAVPASNPALQRDLSLLKKRLSTELANADVPLKRRRGPCLEDIPGPTSGRTVWACTGCGSVLYGPGSTKKQHRPVFCTDCLQKPSVMIGQRLYVYWPYDKVWFRGVVEAYQPNAKMYRVLYVYSCCNLFS